jgi:hypothetical protein
MLYLHRLCLVSLQKPHKREFRKITDVRFCCLGNSTAVPECPALMLSAVVFSWRSMSGRSRLPGGDPRKASQPPQPARSAGQGAGRPDLASWRSGPLERSCRRIPTRRGRWRTRGNSDWGTAVPGPRCGVDLNRPVDTMSATVQRLIGALGLLLAAGMIVGVTLFH